MTAGSGATAVEAAGAALAGITAAGSCAVQQHGAGNDDFAAGQDGDRRVEGVFHEGQRAFLGDLDALVMQHAVGRQSNGDGVGHEQVAKGGGAALIKRGCALGVDR